MRGYFNKFQIMILVLGLIRLFAAVNSLPGRVVVNDPLVKKQSPNPQFSLLLLHYYFLFFALYSRNITDSEYYRLKQAS